MEELFLCNQENKEENTLLNKEEILNNFTKIQYLQKLCTHPLLILNENHPQYNFILKNFLKLKDDLYNINISTKLVALKDLLNECGIGLEEDNIEIKNIEKLTNEHKILIFAQQKKSLDIIEKELFQKYMKSVTYLRLDGSVPLNQRHSIIQNFNENPNINVLLLTTHVGGIGLNLTGADTVIFLEHDWNPMKDLQVILNFSNILIFKKRQWIEHIE